MKDQDKTKEELSELRRRAELAATEKSLGISDVSALSPEKVQQLIHELQVHQIELEMQNEELRRTQQALEASRDKYVALYELAPCGYFHLDQKGVILEANLTGSAILGMARGFLIGKPLASFVNEEDGDALYLHLKQVLETQSEQTCDVRSTKKDGSQIQVRVDSLVVKSQDGSPTVLRTTITDITSRKHTQEALYASELRYRRLFESAQDGILILDFDTGHILDVNPFLMNMLGYSHEEFLERFLWEVTPFKDTALNKDAFAELRQKGYVRYEDLPIETSDGRSIDVEFVSNSYSVAGITFIQCNIRDITERKKGEESLKEASAFLNTLLNAIPAPVFYKDTDGLYLGFNKSYEEFYGKTHQELVGKSVFDIAPRDLAEVYHAKDLELFSNRGNQIYDSQVKDARGAVHDVVFHKSTFSDPSGRVLGLIGVILDITERKQAEKALRESDKQYRTLFEESIDGVYSVLRDGEITDANPAFCELFGYSREEMIGKDIREFFVDPTIRPKFQEEIEIKGFVKDYEVNWQNRNGTEIDCLLTSSLHFGEDGNIVGYRGIARDLTAQKELYRQLLQAQKMEAVGTLAGGIAHDFNNLLTIVMGFSELLLAEKKQDDHEYADLQKIFHAAKNGAELVQRLLMFSRKSEPKPVRMSLNKQIVQVEKLLRHTIPKMVDIHLDLSDDLAEIYADPSQVEQVLMNLAVNARDAMPDGGKLTVSTQTVTLDEEYCRLHVVGATPGDHVLLKLSDTGQGMDKETVEHIFEPFFTTKEIGRGTGLGLAMVYGIVIQHNGHITVYSEVGKGTTFRIYLPAVLSDVEPDVEASGIMPAFGTETVLLVDDEAFVRELGTRVLTKHGYTVIQAADGREALDLFKKERSQISLVILDLIMPEMDGTECLKELLKIDQQVNVLIASGYSADASVKETVQMGAKGFVSKPFRVNELLREVRKVLDEG